MYKIEKIGPLTEHPYASDSTLTGINNHGQVVGYCHSQFLQLSYGFVWLPGTLYSLLPFSGKHCRALGINDHSDVVGEAQSQRLTHLALEKEDALEEHFWPALWPSTPGSPPSEIPFRLATPNDGKAVAINNQREVIGESLLEFWRPTLGSQMQRVPLRSPQLTAGEHFSMVDLNDAGNILGYSYRYVSNWGDPICPPLRLQDVLGFTIKGHGPY